MASEPAPSRASEPVLERLIADRFEVESVLGRGGMGAVYRVRDRHSGRALALKRLLQARSTPLLRQFEREYTTLSQLAHPRIIEVYDYGVDADGAYYTMELLEGRDMSELAPLPYPLACRYLREVAGSLALLHARRLLHRDVSPRNVRLTGDGRCKLLDFGALAAIGEAVAVIGTPPCVAPEALESGPLDPRLDLYALGCLAYFMLVGRHAYAASNVRQLPSYWARPPDPPSAAAPARTRDGQPLPAIPRQLDELVLWLIKLDRLERPASACAVIDRLDVILGQEAGEELELAESYLLGAPTVGREQPLADAERGLEQLAIGRGGVLLFEGGDGAGKTRLLNEVALAARLRGAAVVRVDSELHERPYASAQALVSGLLEVVPQPALEVAAAHAPMLAQALPELAALIGDVAAAEPDDPLLFRSRAQSALRSFILELAHRVPLVLLVDNLQRCDHSSAALIAALALEARSHALLIVCGMRSDVDVVASSACDALRQHARSHALSGLRSDQMQAWLATLFGDVANLPRLAQFLHARTSGSPGVTMELLRFLISAGSLCYRDGTWVLPPEPSALALPEHAEQVVAGRIATLSGTARALARSLSMYRGAITLELCRSLAAPLDDATLQAALDELLALGVLALGRQGYGFRHDTLRDALQREIAKDERAQLQRRIADAILRRNEPHVSERMEAGLHLLEAGDSRGLELLCRGGIELCSRAEGLDACARTLEVALQLCRERRGSPYQLAALLAPLGVAAYMVDRRLERYSDELVSCFESLLGLRLACRLRPWLGKRASSYLGLLYGAIRHALLPRRLRACSFRTLVQVFATAIATLCGRAAICLDRPAIERLAQAIEPLSALGRASAAAYTYDTCRGLALMTEDRPAQIYGYFCGLERRLRSEHALSDVPAEARRLFEGGVDYVLGVFEGVAGDPKALERAERLQASQLDVHGLIAAQLRLEYHAYRGEADQVAQAAAQVEACAIQAGVSWQVETWSAISMNLVGRLWNDGAITKRTAAAAERIAREVPSLARYAQAAKATYLLQRGQPREAIAIAEAICAGEQPQQRLGWSVTMGVLADAYNQVGEHERAKQICEQALGRSDPEDAIYSGLRLLLEVALVIAHASLGEFAQAEQRIESQLASHAQSANPLTLGTLHETAARVAFMRKDRKAFVRHLKEVERCFCPLGNAPLIARFRRLTALPGGEGEMEAKIAAMREVRAFDAALSALSDRALAARHMFAWLMQKCEGFDGYLFARNPAGLELLASGGQNDPPAGAIDLARRSLETLGREEVTTHFDVEAKSARESQPDDLRQRGLHVQLLSYVEGEQFFGEGALVLHGPPDAPPRIRYDLLLCAARHLGRLNRALVDA